MSTEAEDLASKRVRGTSLSTEAMELGFWVVAGSIAGPENLSSGITTSLQGRIPKQVRDQVDKRFQGPTRRLLKQGLRLRDAISSGEEKLTLSLGRYEKARQEIAKQNQLKGRAGSAAWPPGAQTLSARLGGGSWADAMKALGVSADSQGRQKGSGRLAEADFLRALRQFLEECNAREEPTSYSAYNEWAKRRKQSGLPTPSGSTMRQRFGTWSAALAAAGVQSR